MIRAEAGKKDCGTVVFKGKRKLPCFVKLPSIQRIFMSSIQVCSSLTIIISFN